MNARKLRRLAFPVAALVAAVAGSVLAASTINLRPGAETSALNAERAIRNADISQTLRMADLTPENLAAAGLGRLDLNGLADAGLTYCLQADRVTAYAKANKNLNILKANATKPPAKRVTLEGENPPATIAQAQTTLNTLKTDAFTFITSQLDSETKAKLATIRSNAKQPVPAPYKLLTEMNDQKWLELRNALSAKRIATKKNQPVPDSASAVLSQANGNAAVSAALSGFETRLAAIKDEWKTRLPAQQDDNP